MDKTAVFIEKYKKLEATVKEVYGLHDGESISNFLRNRHEYKRFNDEIAYCQQVRNFIQHERKLDDKFAIIPSDEMLLFVDMLIDRINNRCRCIDAGVKLRNICYSSPRGKVKDSIGAMKGNLYTHIPILVDDRVVGVFDENSLFNYIADHGLIDIDDSLEFSDIMPYLSLDDRETESFIFIPSSMYVDEVEDIFHKNFDQNKRIGVAFITAGGKRSEPLQGIITPWDILANNEY